MISFYTHSLVWSTGYRPMLKMDTCTSRLGVMQQELMIGTYPISREGQSSGM